MAKNKASRIGIRVVIGSLIGVVVFTVLGIETDSMDSLWLVLLSISFIALTSGVFLLVLGDSISKNQNTSDKNKLLKNLFLFPKIDSIIIRIGLNVVVYSIIMFYLNMFLSVTLSGYAKYICENCCTVFLAFGLLGVYIVLFGTIVITFKSIFGKKNKSSKTTKKYHGYVKYDSREIPTGDDSARHSNNAYNANRITDDN